MNDISKSLMNLTEFLIPILNHDFHPFIYFTKDPSAISFFVLIDQLCIDFMDVRKT